ncbi:CGNR zinc finger domain-containing protein [Oryzifoliimicrobium ureilyticus]|uniref:CGNR zinc finger domain-containing protein n=1 Tax=Oryzifoliimicrobium ureilyticus TaxID=3113724 RepID=UPI0030765BC4
MTFTWNQHRFSGGALAFDVANSVVLRHDPQRRIDRFEDEDNFANFAQAAAELCAEKERLGRIGIVPAGRKAAFLRLREAVDDYFRSLASAEPCDQKLSELLEASAVVLRHASASSLDRATVHSTLRLLATDEPERIKICGNCGWLFLDRSKNKSRTWCDMSVCGNRVKASRHYRRNREDET